MAFCKAFKQSDLQYMHRPCMRLVLATCMLMFSDFFQDCSYCCSPMDITPLIRRHLEQTWTRC